MLRHLPLIIRFLAMMSVENQNGFADLGELCIRGPLGFASQFCEIRASDFFADMENAVAVSCCPTMEITSGNSKKRASAF